jgi:ADP-ribosylglycohydrolase
MDGTQERVIGVLLGLAAGDMIGGPVRMALRVAESLLNRSGLDVSDIGDRYLLWWRNGAFDTGPTVAAVLALVDEGLTFEQAAAQVDRNAGGMTAGCDDEHVARPPSGVGAADYRSRC